MNAGPAIANVESTHPRWGRLLFLFLFAFFFLYTIAVKPLPSELYSARIAAVIALAVFSIKLILREGRLPLHADLLVVISLYLAYSVWIAVRTVFTGVSDVSLLVSASLYFLQAIPGAVLLAACLHKDRFEFRHLILLLQVVIVTQAAFIVLTFVSWDFRLWTLNLLHESASNIDPLHPYRVRGLTHNTGARLSAFQAIGFFFTFYLLMYHSRGPIFWYLCFSVPLLLGSVLMTGRVGFIGFALAAVATLWWIGIRPSSRGVVKGALLIPAVAVIVCLAFKGIYLAAGAREMAWGEDALASMVRWVVSEFTLYLQSGTLATGTVGGLLENHWFWPSSDAAFLLGDPRTWSVYRIKSDVGVVRMIFGAGLVGTTLLYAACVVTCLITRHHLASRLDKSLVTAVFVWLAVFELKEPSLMNLRSTSLLMILLIFAIWTQGTVTEKPAAPESPAPA